MSAGSYELEISWMGRPLVTNKANKMHWAAAGRERKAWGDAAIQAARIAKMPQETFWGGYSGYFQDPDGYYWEVVWGPMFDHAPDGSLLFRA